MALCFLLCANALALIAYCFVLLHKRKAHKMIGADRRKGGVAPPLCSPRSFRARQRPALAPDGCARHSAHLLGALMQRFLPRGSRGSLRSARLDGGLPLLGARAPTPYVVGRPPCAPRPGTRLAGCVHQACGLLDLGLLPQASGWTPDPRLLRCARRRPQPTAGARRGFPGAERTGAGGASPPTQPPGAGAPSIQRRAAALLDRVCAAPPALVSRRPASAQPPAGVLLGADSWHSGTRPGRPRTAVREKTFGFLWLRPKPLNPVVTYSVFFPITWR